MNFTDYNALIAAIQSELNRDDLSVDAQAFVSLCESQTERQLRTREMIVSTTLTIDQEQEDLPVDFLETRQFYLNTNPITPLQFRTIDSLIAFKQANGGVGKPTDYTVIGSKVQVSKAPDSAYTATLIYYSKIPRLSNTTTTNWLLASHPDVYFYGSLLNSAPYLREDARIPVWAQLYQAAVDALNIADERATTASNALKQTARMF